METPLEELLRSETGKAGAVRTRFARAGAVSSAADASLREWIAAGCHAGMDWMPRHAPLRADTANVLPGARSVICCAFSYYPLRQRAAYLPAIAFYAYGRDYHDVLRRRLAPVAGVLRSHGFEARICIDSAPVSERYWACACGVGTAGLNGSVIVPGAGSFVVLAEILTDAELTPDAPLGEELCNRCGKCVKACPTGALRGDGTLRSDRCLNYLTIEKRGDWSEEERELTAAAPPTLFGCDICQRVCPLNASPEPCRIPEFAPSKQLLELKAEDLASMTQADLTAQFPGSPLKRARIEGLHRNARAVLDRD